MPDLSPPLLDIVPWNHGYAHSWVVAWLIENEPTRVLEVLAPGGSPPWTLEGPVRREYMIRGARADLACDVRDASGRTTPLAIETKVADPIKPTQLERYRDEGFHTRLFVPGLTGLLFEPNGSVAGERWVTGRDVAMALDGVALPPIISSYLDAVATEAQRMEDARAAARGERDDFEHDGQAPYHDLADAAWIVEVVAAMRERGAEDIIVRTEANDRGLFWRGVGRQIPACAGASLYIDVIADLRTHRRAVAVKVADGDQDGRWQALAAAIAGGEPSPAPWKPARRRTSRTQTVWKLDATGITASETAKHAMAAGDFIRALAGGA